MAFGSPQWMYSSGGDYEIEQSLRTNDGDSAYLSWTPASAGNKRTYTWSGWVKRGELGSQNTIFGAGNGGSFFDELCFSSADQLDWYTYQNATQGQRKSTAKFRDTSAWYHIVAVYDSTDSTALNRMKLYVNGEQITDLATTTNPSQNHEGNINNNIIHAVGAVYAGQLYNPYDGYMAEVNFIDGQALTPADFGETGDYGEWKPKEYSGSYGTNGFYLPFKADYTVEGFSTVTWRGNGVSGNYIGGTGFKPGLTWIKERSGPYSHVIADPIRGNNTFLSSSQSGAEDIDSTKFQNFATDGFTVGTHAGVNSNGETYVGWNWDMGADTPTGFGAVTYEGTTTNLSVSGFGFSPDLVWIKRRSGTAEHSILDTVRGNRKFLSSDGTGAELDRGYLPSFDPDGFTVEPSVSNSNSNGETYVAWGWDMGGTTATNTSGSINSQVRANTTYGQSIVSYTGNGTAGATVGHGLSSAPEMIILKRRSSSQSWFVYHKDFGTPGHWQAKLNNSDAPFDDAGAWNDTAPSNSLITFGNSGATNQSSGTFIAYCFHSVSGYSKFGSYTGNGSTTGPTVTLGFRPAFLMIKRTDDAGDWAILDSTRNPLNNVQKMLRAQGTDAEADVNNSFTTEFTDTGFQCKADNGYFNANGGTYIYMAFAGGMDSISDYNDTGSLDSRVKANPTYGQSVVSYTGNTASSATVGHGLSSAPEMMIVRTRGANAWAVYHTSIGNTHLLELNTTAAKADNNTFWNDTSPTNSVFTIGSHNEVNHTDGYIAYCFHSVTGYSKFGTYEGTAGTHTVTLGFAPAFLMIKNADSAGRWTMWDNTRSPNNNASVGKKMLRADVDSAEDTKTDREPTWLDTGFSIGDSDGDTNASGDTYIYMAFADKREYAYWLDQSGNNNDWTSNNLTESDISVDSPTNNFATYNPLHAPSIGTFSEGNLKHAAGGQVPNISSMAMSSGKWYAEFYCVSGTYTRVGIANELSTGIYGGNLGGTAGSWAKINNAARLYHNASATTYGAEWDAGQIAMVAFDADAGKIWYGVDGVWDASGNPATAANPSQSSVTGTDFFFATTSGSGTLTYVVNFGQDSSFAGNKTAQGNQDGNDLGDFYYTPPTGFLSLCTKNLPDVAVTPSEHFNTILYSGNSTNGTGITGVGFAPNFVWIKPRNLADNHILVDSVRGNNAFLKSNATSSENSISEAPALNADGFTVGNWSNVNGTGKTYVAWNWKANGSGSSNTDGTITSTVSANVDAGFSIASYTGIGTAGATIGHGLSKAPEMIWVKSRTDADDWYVYYGDNTDYLILNGTTATQDNVVCWNDTSPTANVFSVGTAAGFNGNGKNLIAYCFHSVDGYSKVGSYKGNGNADGTFVYTGFRPAWYLVKDITAGVDHWHIQDSTRNTFNYVGKNLKPSFSGAETDASSQGTDFLSNGFKPRFNNSHYNENGHNYIYRICRNTF